MYQTIINPFKSKDLGPCPFYFPACAGGHYWSTVNLTNPLVVPKGESREEASSLQKYERSMPKDGKWSQIVRSGQIKMTPGMVLNEFTSYPLASFAHAYAHYQEWGSAAVCGGTPVWGSPNRYVGDFVATWTEQGDFLYWSEKYRESPSLQGSSSNFEADIQRAKTSAWSELIQTYDLGTELAELHDTLHAGIAVLQAARAPIRTLTEILRSKPKDFANYWMQYRYVLMPLIYSGQDISKLIEQKDFKYKTVRRRVEHEVWNPELVDGMTCWYTERLAGFEFASITAKGRWDTSNLRLLGQVGLNPVSTAWELIPLSFVVDWFFNFGEYLTAVAGQWTNLATELQGCVSIRSNYIEQTCLRIVIDDRKRYTESYKGLLCYDEMRGQLLDQELVLAIHHVDNYGRSLFNEKDLRIVNSAFLNWKRMIDGQIILISQLKKVFR